MAKKRKHHQHRRPAISRGISAYGIYGQGGYYGGFPGDQTGGGTAQDALNGQQFGGAGVDSGGSGDGGGSDGGGASV